MSDVITILDRQAAELFASSRNTSYTRGWLESREGYLQALRDERTKPSKAIKDARPPMPEEAPQETWGAP